MLLARGYDVVDVSEVDGDAHVGVFEAERISITVDCNDAMTRGGGMPNRRQLRDARTEKEKCRHCSLTDATGART